ncbi:tetratricopeptide repeat protein [Persicitalea sp.]|uniref:tetratricopeptide repeat-containing sensor histidine kinase n=1 Tax=Persicitalea sp. TaxID=3100273 RepID=UPI0035933F0B
MRRVIVVIGLLLGAEELYAQNQVAETPLAAISHWENKPKSPLRDTTLIRLYAREAASIADLDSSLFWLQKGFKSAFALRSNKWLAFTHNRIGATYLQKGVTFKAIEYLFRGVQYAELAKATDEQAFAWDHIGDCYANLKTYGKAITAEKRAIEFYKKSNSQSAQTRAMIDLGAAYREDNRPEEAITILQQSLKINSDREYSDERAEAYFNLAATFLKKEDFANAEKHGLLALNAENNNKGRPNAELLSLISLIYSRNDQPKKSQTFADRAQYYIIYEQPPMRERVALNLFEAYKSLQKPDEALAWHEKFVDLRESNRAEAQNKRVEVLRYEYDAQQREAQMQAMIDDMTRQAYLRNALILGILVFLGLAAALGRSNRLLQKRRRELDRSNSQLTKVGKLLKQTNATLEERVAERTNELRQANHTLTRKNHEIQEALFRGQSIERERVASELHNNLGSLLSGVKWRLESVELDNFSPAEKEQYRSVVGLISDAYNQVRHISHNLLPSILEKQGLVPALEKLTSDLNRSGRASFELVGADEISIEDKKVSFELYSCILELINNILKHARASQVVLELVQTESFYVLMITDDGTGIMQEKITTSGKGLENIRQRMNSLNGTFAIRSLRNKKGTTVTLRVPRQTQEAEA